MPSCFLRREVLSLIILVFALGGLMIPAHAEQSCDIRARFPLLGPGYSTAVVVEYSRLTAPQPIVVVCTPNQWESCDAGIGNGSCEVTCTFPYQGEYALPAASPFMRCSGTAVIVSPSAKPACVIMSAPNVGYDAMSSTNDIFFANLRHDISNATASCGEGQAPKVIYISDNTASFICAYSTGSWKKVFQPEVSTPDTACNSTIVVYPSVDDIAPTANFLNVWDRLAVNSTYIVEVNASDNVEVSYVELYMGGFLAGNTSSPPYAFPIDVTGYPEGANITLMAVAHDAAGHSGNSDEKHITRGYSGQAMCNMTAIPIYGVVPARINLSAVFTNLSSDVLEAQILADSDINDSVTVGVDNSRAWRVVSYNVSGTHTALATAGNATCNTLTYVTSYNDTIPPTVYISSPTRGSSYQIGDIVDLEVSAFDNVAVYYVEYYVDDVLVGNATDMTDPTFLYEWNTTNTSIGFHQIVAKAYDVAMNFELSQPVETALRTTNTCEISPNQIQMLPGTGKRFEVSCYNLTYPEVSYDITNGTPNNFTVNEVTFNQSSLNLTPCGPMQWSTTIYRSYLSTNVSSNYTDFSAPSDDREVDGVLTATDPISKVSCSADVFIVRNFSTCMLSANPILDLGEDLNVNVSYDFAANDTVTVICRPNVYAKCYAPEGTGQCVAVCSFVSTGSFPLNAYSRRAHCSPTNVSVVLPTDTVPPILGITWPEEGRTIDGNVTIQVYAHDDSGIRLVMFYIDGAFQCTSNEAPYECKWDAGSSRPGPHTLRAIAYDNAGNRQAKQITIYS